MGDKSGNEWTDALWTALGLIGFLALLALFMGGLFLLGMFLSRVLFR